MSVDSKKISALVSLLGDSDLEVSEIARNEILNIGKEVIPFLEDSYLLIESNQQKDALDAIIHKLKMEKIYTELSDWMNGDQRDLLTIWCAISELSGRAIDRDKITKELEQLKVEIWLGLQSNQSVVEKISYFNHVFFEKNGFIGDSKDYNHPSNSFIDTVIQNKKGNPISLSALYLIIAQKLKLPVYGVNLPQHFVLAFMHLDIDLLDSSDIVELSQGNEIDLPIDKESEPIFYINPFNKGTIFSKKHLESFLKELKIQPQQAYFQICDNEAIVRRMLRNLQVSYAKMNNEMKKSEIDLLIEILDDKS